MSAIWHTLLYSCEYLDTATHQINHYQRIVWFALLTLIHWIAIYSMDCVIQSLNNWGLMGN